MDQTLRCNSLPCRKLLYTQGQTEKEKNRKKAVKVDANHLFIFLPFAVQEERSRLAARVSDRSHLLNSTSSLFSLRGIWTDYPISLFQYRHLLP